MTQFHGTDEVIREYQRDTGGYFFSADTMRFFGCKPLEVVNLPNDVGAVVIMRQLKNGFRDSTTKTYRAALYTRGTEHRCECCNQRDEQGTIDYLEHDGDADFDTLRQVRAYVKTYAATLTAGA